MRQTFAVLVIEKREPGDIFGSTPRHPNRAFIVEADTAKKAENALKKSSKGAGFDVLGVVEAEQLPVQVYVTMIKEK